MVCKNCGRKVFAKETCQCGEKAPNVHGAGVAFNSIVCTVLLVLSAIFLIVTMSLRDIVNNDVLVNTINDTDLCSVEVKDGSGKDIKLDQYIYDNYIDDDRITVENVDNVLKDPFIKNFITEKLEGYNAFFMDESDMVYITSDDIVNLIDENSDLLFNEAGLQFLDADKQELKDSLSGLDKFSQFSEDYLTGWFSSGLIRTFFSYANVVFLATLMAVILIQWIVVYKLNSRRIGKVFRKYSIALIVPSFIIDAASLLTLILGRKNIVGALVADVRWSFITASSILLACGIVLLLISIPMYPKKKKGEYSVPVQPETAEQVTEVQPETSPELVTVPAEETKFSTESAEDVEKEPQQQSSPAGLCPSCGHQNKETSAFCSQCGTKLK